MSRTFRQNFLSAIAAPGTALVLAIVMSSIVLLVSGSNPIEAYGDMVEYASRLEIMIDILNRATPLYLAGVAAAIGFRMNLFNIGIEGQYLLAFLFAAQVGGHVSLPAVLHVGLIMLVAMAVGAAYSGLAGVLKVTRGVNEVISTIMLNAIAISGILAWLVAEWQAGGALDAGGPTRAGTEPIDESGLLPHLNSWVEVFTREIRGNAELGAMIIVALAIGAGYHVLLHLTWFGFDLRASGANPRAAEAGGVPPKRMVLIAMVLSGAVAGLIGLQELNEVGYFSANPIRGLGLTGLAVALLGRHHPVGIAVAALIFSFLDVSSGILQLTGAASREIVVIMQGAIIFVAVVAYEIARRAREREETRTAAAALATGAA